jgi:endonuclease/exonuclease/phosphatase family metal-dependent hydrolase
VIIRATEQRYARQSMARSTFRVLTLNTLFRPHARERLRAIAPALNASGVDFLCLQEVVYGANVRLLERSLTDFISCANRPFWVWAMGGLVNFARKKIDASSFEVFQRRGEWLSIGAADRLLRKGFLTSRLIVGRQKVAVINTHLLANYDQDWSPRNRFAMHQAAELEQLGRAVVAVPEDTLVIVAGDFNVLATSPMLEEFASQARLRSVFEAIPPPSTYRQPGSDRPDLAIDHILYHAPAGLVSNVSAGIRFDAPVAFPDGRTGFASDHVAVEAEFTLEG